MRRYTTYAQQPARDNLELLINPNTTIGVYSDAMRRLGRYLGDGLVDELLKGAADVCVAVGVEDADFLAKGLVDALVEAGHTVHLACFWNERYTPEGAKESVAPIFKRYVEPGANNARYLVVAKSIISSACVVRTNLLNLIETMSPDEIFIVAPVIYKGAEASLRNGFPEDVYQRFRFLYLAEDDDRLEDGTVVPGVGGNVYSRLGFGTQEDKNRVTPELVRHRRSLLLSSRAI